MKYGNILFSKEVGHRTPVIWELTNPWPRQHILTKQTDGFQRPFHAALALHAFPEVPATCREYSSLFTEINAEKNYKKVASAAALNAEQTAFYFRGPKKKRIRWQNTNPRGKF